MNFVDWLTETDEQRKNFIFHYLVQRGMNEDGYEWFLRNLRKRSTFRQYEEFLNSAEGLCLECQRREFKPSKCREALEKLREHDVSRALAVWQQCLVDAREMAKETNVTSEQVKILAEELCCEGGYCPPHWNTLKKLQEAYANYLGLH